MTKLVEHPISVRQAFWSPYKRIARLKLRQRNLGPMLDGNGWAVNVLSRIRIPFGGSLTRVARLPAGAQRSLDDPFAEKGKAGRAILLLAVLAAVALIYLWVNGSLGEWFDWLMQRLSAPSAPAPR